jgi:thioredoxin 1
MEKIKGGLPRKEHRRTYIMEPQVFFEKLKQNPRPVVVDLWAPWCGPCKVIKPTLANLAREYQGRVDVWEINADDSQDLLRQLKIYGVPTLIGYQDGQEIARYIGAKPRSELQSFFESLSAGKIPKSSGLSNWDRSIRLMVGTFVVGVAWTNHFHWTILGVGAVIMFSAIYDRCPIWKAITAHLKKIILK